MQALGESQNILPNVIYIFIQIWFETLYNEDGYIHLSLS